ncbi:MAG: Cu(I)-responsive transcriptional regulator [Burkholderiaceae bacterium]
MAQIFNIGQAAQRARVSPKMVRHYESLGLLPQVSRSDAGYRQYTDKEVHTLHFIKRSRDLGFSMAEISELLGLWQNKRRPSASVKHIASLHVATLDLRIEELSAMKRALEKLVECCHGDQRPDCPILDELGQDPA